jgi:hypothetical protein
LFSLNSGLHRQLPVPLRVNTTKTPSTEIATTTRPARSLSPCTLFQPARYQSILQYRLNCEFFDCLCRAACSSEACTCPKKRLQLPGYRKSASGYPLLGLNLDFTPLERATMALDKRTAFQNPSPIFLVLPTRCYGVILVNPAKHPHVKHELGQDFIDWLIC